ncbi:hypothetical protein IVG45_09585 [Methylomonas sp. LL1]|uniref:hypothetical protein n=1 Tax=Methylomonas sp. LL1 TaxID=2785785 RepID=UPI0018C42154|nr:hypothetical protein [Methylomonas sp. LL1]QPK65156.1 hypothetical protein IVG45_09585 [Methylomonas sp. LL1]
MALTVLPENTPLTQLRAQGLEAEFDRARLVMYPRPKITNTIRQFVVDNLEAIVDELNLEGYYTKNSDPLGYSARNNGDVRRNQGWLIWSLDDPTRAALGAKPVDLTIDSVPDSMNGNLAI